MNDLKLPRMLTVDEIYRECRDNGCRLSKQWLYNVAKSGKVKAFRAGSRILINADSLSSYLENCTLTDELEQISGIRPIK